MVIAQAAEGRDLLDVIDALGPYVVAIVSVLGALWVAEVAHRRERARALEVQREQAAEAERVRRADAAAADARWRRDRVTDTVLEALSQVRRYHRSGQNELHALATFTSTPVDQPARVQLIELYMRHHSEANDARQAAERCGDLLRAYGLNDMADVLRSLEYPTLGDDNLTVDVDADPSTAHRYVVAAVAFDAALDAQLRELEQLVQQYLTRPPADDGA